MEIGENLSITAVIAIVATSIVLLAQHGCSEVEETKRAAFEAGLEEVQLNGSTITRFGKPE